MWYILTFFRNIFYDFGVFKSFSFESEIKTIGVGNLSFGGTGKTPHASYIIEFLIKNFHPDKNIAFLSRGYGRNTKGFLEVKNGLVTSDQFGDEPIMIKELNPESLVFVDQSRVRGVQNIVEQKKNVKAVVLDDVFQHRKLSTGLMILLTRSDKLYTKDFIAPLGTLREAKANARRADIIIVTGGFNSIPPIEKRLIKEQLNPGTHQHLFFSHIVYKSIKPLHAFNYKHSLNKKTSVFLFTGIAHTEHIFYHIKMKVNKLEHLKFKDHHAFSKKDVNKIYDLFNAFYGINKIILTTQKDVTRLKHLNFAKKLFELPFYVLPITIDFDASDKENFHQQILKYVRSN